MPRSKRHDIPQTTAQRLGAIIKSCRNIMRKDKGLNGDVDRLPMLTWIMFLKFLDDMERLAEEEAIVSGKQHLPLIRAPYRWRDWAASGLGLTGDDLLEFVNADEVTLPDGTRGPGLFAYLRALQSPTGRSDRRDVIAAVFQGTHNRMTNGYLLRDVLGKIDGVHFTSSDEISTIGHLYEIMLKDTRDAAGDSGEFYTPRPVVRFMVDVVDPKLGETVLDPACGTGGFLVEVLRHLERQVSTTEDRQTLQQRSIFGGEAKSLPYLLCQMNLVLHGMESPNIDYGNSLRYPLWSLGDGDRYDVILTNPPFGGEEETGIRGNFPPDKQTAETALLFLQVIMRRLRRSPRGGRAAVIVPNGTLFGDGVGARVREELVTQYNLHTVVRMPEGVFSPYSDIPTNILFFERSRPTEHVWYYELPLPSGRKKYTKTQPIRYEEFAECQAWWNHRDTQKTQFAWRVDAAEIANSGYVLDIKNPNQPTAEMAPSALELADALLSVENRIIESVTEVRRILEEINGR